MKRPEGYEEIRSGIHDLCAAFPDGYFANWMPTAAIPMSSLPP
jgi:hypothetical protein